MKNQKEKPKIETIKKIEFQENREEPSEKFFISLPNGIVVGSESSKKTIEELANISINSVNEVLRFNEILKDKQRRSYYG